MAERGSGTQIGKMGLVGGKRKVSGRDKERSPPERRSRKRRKRGMGFGERREGDRRTTALELEA